MTNDELVSNFFFPWFVLWIVGVAMFVVPLYIGNKLEERFRRRAYVRTYVFPQTLGEHLQSQRPELSTVDCNEIVEGLRTYFLISLGVTECAALPSLAVADAWSAFAQSREAYSAFCGQVFGKYRAPGHYAEPDSAIDALCWTWRRSCKLEGIDWRFPRRLPRLFAIDARLSIKGGSRYSIDADNQPLCDHLSPTVLTGEIRRRLPPRLPQEERTRPVAFLARRIRASLGLERYPYDWSDENLVKLFNVMICHPDLLAAVFGDTDMAVVQRELERAKRTPREPEPPDGA